MSIQNSVAFNNAIKACFDVYYNYTNIALSLSSEEQGELHNGILLEVRSAMTHIGRANCAPKITIKKRIEEIKSAQGHFIRAALDGYKIAYAERMKKIGNHIETLEKYHTHISADFQQDRNSLESRRANLTLEENKNPTSLKTLDDYKHLYINTSEYYEKLITQYDDNELKKFRFKKVFMHRESWFYTIVGALISAVIGAIVSWFLGILF